MTLTAEKLERARAWARAYADALIEARRPAVRREHVTEYEPHQFVTEASTLGLPPGTPPWMLTTELGNGQPFEMTGRRGAGWEYRQQFGNIVLTVLND